MEVDFSKLDEGIRLAVQILREAQIETFESCEGGVGHSYSEPTVRFYGKPGEGFRAYGVAIDRGLPVGELRRTWPVEDGELAGPCWELTFRSRARNSLGLSD